MKMTIGIGIWGGSDVRLLCSFVVLQHESRGHSLAAPHLGNVNHSAQLTYWQPFTARIVQHI